MNEINKNTQAKQISLFTCHAAVESYCGFLWCCCCWEDVFPILIVETCVFSFLIIIVLYYFNIFIPHLFFPAAQRLTQIMQQKYLGTTF